MAQSVCTIDEAVEQMKTVLPLWFEKAEADEKENKFCCDFDDIWKWVGYSNKGNAKRKLEDAFDLNKDYSVAMCENKTKTRGGQNRQVIMLTVEAAKMFMMQTNNERGNAIRQYFLDVEQEYLATASPATKKRKIDAFVSALCVPITSTSREKAIADSLAMALNGVREVVVEHGRVDIVTNDEIIEVKTASKWKHALGQLLAYTTTYPQHRLRMHLFDCDTINLIDIISVCGRYHVDVTTEP
jgi:phage anti-repressor protein